MEVRDILRKAAQLFLAALVSVVVTAGSITSNNFGLGETLTQTRSVGALVWNLPASSAHSFAPDNRDVPRVRQGTLLIGPSLWDPNSEGLYQIAIAFFLVAHQNFLSIFGERWQAWSQPEDMLYPPLGIGIRKQIEPNASVRKRHPSYFSHKA